LLYRDAVPGIHTVEIEANPDREYATARKRWTLHG
jgi:hypothetical protein